MPASMVRQVSVLLPGAEEQVGVVLDPVAHLGDPLPGVLLVAGLPVGLAQGPPVAETVQAVGPLPGEGRIVGIVLVRFPVDVVAQVVAAVDVRA